MKLYDGEDWFLQLDSHHRFEQDWDRGRDGSHRDAAVTIA